MKKIGIISFLSLFLFLMSYESTYTWGFFAHRKANRMAVFTLPPEMIGFYKRHIEFITEHAVDPDKRRYAVKGEAERHYIDIDHYAGPGEDPFEVVPENWFAAVDKFTEDTLRAYGIVPWHIPLMVNRLTEAFRRGQLDRILNLSADLGHYVGDAHVPLHTTKNYNGQLTNQKGIHGFWESRLPELYYGEYNYFVGRAEFIEDVQSAAWQFVKESFAAKDSVLEFEAQLNEMFPSDKKFSYEERGRSLMKVYSEEYSKEYDKMLNGMVERRLRSTIHNIGNVWYTAWVNAGQPDLDKLDSPETIKKMKKELAEKEKLWKTGGNIEIKGHSD